MRDPKTNRRRLTFGLPAMLWFTLFAAVVMVAIRIWTGPTLDQRLMTAAYAGDSRTFAFLVWLGADVGTKTHGYGSSPIQDAAYAGNLEAVKLYADHGAFLDYMEKDCFTPITYAAMEGHWDVVVYLFDSGASPRVSDATGRNAITYAREANRTDITERLESRPPAPDAVDPCFQ